MDPSAEKNGAPGRPGLTLVLGPPNSGKMGFALEWWRERLSFRPVAVAPTAADAQGLTVEMVRRVGALVGQSPAFTFDGLVRTIVGRSLQLPGEFERTLIMSRLLRDTPLRSLKVMASMPGAGATLARLLQQLGESGREPAELYRSLDRWARVEPGAAGLAADIRHLHGAYVDACAARGLTDGPAATREAVAQAAGWTRPIAFYGFTSFTRVQQTLIKALSGDAQILVTLPYEPTRESNLSTASEVAGWKAMAGEVIELLPQIRAYSSPVIAYLERHFMSDLPPREPPPPSSGPQGVRFLLASGQRNEAELVAQQIAGLLRDGFRPGDVGVIVRRLRTWSSLLTQVFGSCGIPYRIDESRALAETGLGYALLSMLRGVLRDDAEAVLVYLRSPYSGLAPDVVADLELRYRREARYGARVVADVGEDLCPGLLAPLWEVITADPGRPCIDPAGLDHVSRRMLSAAIRAGTPGDQELEEDARAFRALAEASSAMSRLGGLGGDAAWSEAEMVLDALAGVAIPSRRSEGKDAVQVLSVQRARARRFAVVAVLGLTEGEFPGHSDPPSLLTPAQRARLDSLGGGGLFVPETNEEVALFVSALSRAWQLLLLSARDADDGGGEVMPSRFWSLSKELLGVGETENETRTLAEVVFGVEAAPSLRHYLRACAARSCPPHPGVWSDPDRVRKRSWRRAPARLTDQAILDELAATDSFTPSSLETYLTCPFLWFVDRVIGIEDLEPELDLRSAGQLLHGVLSATYRELGSRDELPLRPDNIVEAERLALVNIERLVRSEGCPGTPAEKRLTAWTLRKLVRGLFHMETTAASPLVTLETESTIGGREGVDIGGLRIRGRVDRIDGDPQTRALFVLDYKSGTVPGFASLGTERALQLPLYLMALAAERPEARVIGGAYLSPGDERRSGVVHAGSEHLLGAAAPGCRVIDQTDADRLFGDTRAIALDAARGMRAGSIAPRPESACPPWCRLGPVCRARPAGYRPR